MPLNDSIDLHGRRSPSPPSSAAAPPRRRPPSSTASSTPRAAASSRSAATSTCCSSTTATCRRSFLGVRGSEDLGGGLRAVYRLESYLRVDTGAAGRDDGDALLGARGERRPLGLVRHDGARPDADAALAATIVFNPFGESIGFSPTRAPVLRRRGARRHALEQLGLVHQQPAATRCASTSPPTPTRRRRPARTATTWALSVAYITGPFAATSSASGPATAASRCRRVRPPDRAARRRDATTSRSFASTGRSAAIKTDATRRRADDALPARRRGAARQQPDPGRLRPARTSRRRRSATTDRIDVDRLRLLPVEEHRHLRRRDRTRS